MRVMAAGGEKQQATWINTGKTAQGEMSSVLRAAAVMAARTEQLGVLCVRWLSGERESD